ncbi:MAG TPA: beta-ketoacyl-[acyl-carrier-protein] synthase family protein [Thermoanaerobaculia bacterium]|jgi:3-oxoacyl-[acyl-carrier-protein] synthase II|nr:beta-ketoacyl-[acyl-carrier-protein] synthase family protein [Thermoanaerobaculia bacterium]
MHVQKGSRIVITGVGALSPNGVGRETYFAALKAGRSGVRSITQFDASKLPCRVAGEVNGGFNPQAWVDAKNMKHVGRVVPMAIAATDEALRDAKLDPQAVDLETRRNIGVMLGSGGGAIEFSERMYELWYRGAVKQASVYAIPSGTIGTLASEISMAYDLHGFSHLISTGCTSSTDAIGYAYRNLTLGVCDYIVTGGADSTITEGIMTGFSIMRIVSSGYNDAPETASRPFSRNRDGFVLGEGAWMFVMEREETALARGAHIYAEVAGYGSTCDAYHRVRMDDSGEEPARAMQLAMKDAAVEPEQIGYINYHGTSTDLNDRIETRAVKRAFGAHAALLPGSATKSMIGHPQGACGAAGVAATLMAFRDHTLPPTINLDPPDPECDLDYIPDLGRRAEIDAAVCNTIAFGSKNSALVLKRYV